jgi:hypothetical protein
MLATAALGEKAMSSFRRYLAGALLLTMAVLFSDSAWAFELTGVWATDPTICDKVFTKRGKQIVFAELSDLYGSGYIIEGNRLLGKVARCAVKSKTENGSTIHLMARCSTGVAAENFGFEITVLDDNSFSRLFSGKSEMEATFYRCTL